MTKNKKCYLHNLDLRTILIFVLVIFVFSIPIEVYAQLPQGPDTHRGILEHEDREKHFGIGLLLASISAVGIVIFLIFQKRKKKNLGDFRTTEEREYYFNGCNCHCHVDDTLKADNSCQHCYENKKPCREHDM